MSVVKVAAILVIATFIFVLLNHKDSIIEKSINHEILQFHNIRSIEDGSSNELSDLDITSVNMNKRPGHYVAEAYDSISFLEWNPDIDMLRNASMSRKPIKWVGSPASTWNSLKWNLTELAERWSVLDNVLMTESSGLHFSHQERDIGGMLGSDSNDPYYPDLIFEMSFKKFLYYSASPNMYLFYSTNFRVMESLAKLSGDCGWRDFAIVEALGTESLADTNPETKSRAPPLELRQPPPQLAVSHSGVVLQANLKEHHTVRVQIRGRARYVLFAPSQHTSLYLFPYIHVGYHQSQVIMESDGNLDMFSNFSKLRPIEVILNPGQALYIPPYWLVRSEFMSLSMHLDINSLSDTEVRLAEAQFTDIPLGNFTTDLKQRTVAAQIYLVHFLSRLDGLRSPKSYISHHYANRYASLFPLEGIYMRKLLKGFTCYANDQLLYESVLSSMDKPQLQMTAQYVADIVNDNHIPRGVKWIWVGDYVDRIARWAMNDPGKAPMFLARCMEFDKKVEVISPLHEELGPNVMKIGSEGVGIEDANIVDNTSP